MLVMCFFVQFHMRSSKLRKIQSDDRMDSTFEDVLHRLTTSVTVATVSTLFIVVYIFVAPRPWGQVFGYFALDAVINCVCILIAFDFGRPVFEMCCRPCLCLCDVACAFVARRTEEDKISAIVVQE